MNAQEIINIISKQWCTIDDLCKLAGCGRNKALDIKKHIIKELIDKGYYVPPKNIPMLAVVKYLNIDIEYLEHIIKIIKN